MWSLGGLSARELVKRTARETWQDDVFGQAARLAFYHFLAIFPVLLLLLIPLAHMAGAGADMRGLLAGSTRQFLPSDAASLITDAIQDLNLNADDGGGHVLLVAALGAIWAGFNASWAMIAGLNIAYDIDEDRPWSNVAGRAGCLAFAVLSMVVVALFATHYLGREVVGARSGILSRIAQWCAIIGILTLSFGLFYRFGPNRKGIKWQWSTPGAVFGATLWVAATLIVQFYFDRLGSHHEIYGRLAATAAFLIWLYMTSATVLIGAELNSEIEKAREESGMEEKTAGADKRGH